MMTKTEQYTFEKFGDYLEQHGKLFVNALTWRIAQYTANDKRGKPRKYTEILVTDWNGYYHNPPTLPKIMREYVAGNYKGKINEDNEIIYKVKHGEIFTVYEACKMTYDRVTTIDEILEEI